MTNLKVIRTLSRVVPYERQWTAPSLVAREYFGKLEGEFYRPSEVSHEIEYARIKELDACHSGYVPLSEPLKRGFSVSSLLFHNESYTLDRLSVDEILELFVHTDSAHHSAGYGRVGTFDFAGKTKARCLQEESVVACFREFYDDLAAMPTAAFRAKWREYLIFNVAFKTRDAQA